MHSLIFVDTNVFLDLYRSRGQGSLALIDHVALHHPKFISTSQVEMEFLKNRQSVICASLAEPNAIPHFLRDDPRRPRDNAPACEKWVTERLRDVLVDPKNDPVYRAIRFLFSPKRTLHLASSHASFRRLSDRARERFALNYPPRKPKDATFGDALNWEWIVQCATERNVDVVVASRDKDYGVTLDDEAIMNDWLQAEFKRRVGRGRRARLTPNLSTAYLFAGIPVEKAERERELADFRAKIDLSLADLLPIEERIVRMRTGYRGESAGALRLLRSMLESQRDDDATPDEDE